MLTLLSLAWLACAQDPVEADPAPAAPPPVVQLRLEGPLDETWASILRRAEEQVLASGAQGLLIELDTPGGEVELMKRLGKRIDRIGKSCDTVCLVDTRAISAGSYLAISFDEIWMVPGATLGDAMPIAPGPGGLPIELPEDLKEKSLSYVRAEFRAWAEVHGRDPGLAEAFVDPGIELQRVSVRGEIQIVNRTEYDDLLQRGEQPSFLEVICPAGELLTLDTNQALEFGYCDGVAENRAILLERLGWDTAPAILIEATWSEKLVRGIGSWSWLLLLASAFFVVVSLQMPGLGVPEGLAILCILVFLFHGYLIGLAEWTEILLVVAGAGLIAVEVFVLPGTLIAGITGGLLLLGGLVLVMQDFGLPQGTIETEVFRDNLLRILVLVLSAPVIGMFLVRRLTRTRVGAFLTSTPSEDFAGSVAGESGGRTAPRIEAGARGRCLTPLRPAGRIEVDGEPYDALSQGDFLAAGQAVTVLGRQGISLLVAPDEEAPE